MIDLRSRISGGELSIYVHIPFCIAKCRYCDFVSYKYSEYDALMYMGALKQEIQQWAGALAGSHCRVKTVYVGGGTPTCLNSSAIPDLLERIHGSVDVQEDAEITVEANPGTLDVAKLRQLRDVGVNRLSLGVQAFDNSLLACLGRIHTAQEAERAVHLVQDAGLEKLNIDLMFGVPTQSKTMWMNTLNRAISLGPSSIAAYELILEDDTVMHRLVQDHVLELPTEEMSEVFFETAIELLSSSGYAHYEISNFAKKGSECEHNKTYWRNEQYLGLGVAAHSSVRSVRWHNYTSLKDYVNAVPTSLPVESVEVLDTSTQMWETVFLGLRMLDEGVLFGRFQNQFRTGLQQVYGDVLERLSNAGLLQLADDRVILTHRGLFVANQVFTEF